MFCTPSTAKLGKPRTSTLPGWSHSTPVLVVLKGSTPMSRAYLVLETCQSMLYLADTLYAPSAFVRSAPTDPIETSPSGDVHSVVTRRGGGKSK